MENIILNHVACILIIVALLISMAIFLNPLKLLKKFLDNRIKNLSLQYNELSSPKFNNYKENAIIFLGDSITEEFRLNEFFPGQLILNRGISGDTTDGMLSRIKENCLCLKPYKLFILAGINDLGKGTGIEKIAGNFALILDIVKKESPKAKIYVQSIYPVNENYNNKKYFWMVGRRKNSKIDELNSIINTISFEYGAKYIDVSSFLKDKSGQLRDEFTTDGIHLRVKGYCEVAKIIKEYIR